MKQIYRNIWITIRNAIMIIQIYSRQLLKIRHYVTWPTIWLLHKNMDETCFIVFWLNTLLWSDPWRKTDLDCTYIITFAVIHWLHLVSWGKHLIVMMAINFIFYECINKFYVNSLYPGVLFPICLNWRSSLVLHYEKVFNYTYFCYKKEKPVFSYNILHPCLLKGLFTTSNGWFPVKKKVT